MYYEHNTQESRNPCYRGKALNITYSDCVSVALVTSTQSACAVLYCHLWPFWLYNIFAHYLINCTTSGKRVIEYKNVYFDFPFKFF